MLFCGQEADSSSAASSAMVHAAHLRMCNTIARVAQQQTRHMCNCVFIQHCGRKCTCSYWGCTVQTALVGLVRNLHQVAKHLGLFILESTTHASAILSPSHLSFPTGPLSMLHAFDGHAPLCERLCYVSASTCSINNRAVLQLNGTLFGGVSGKCMPPVIPYVLSSSMCR
jgi:hypothetical protein